MDDEKRQQSKIEISPSKWCAQSDIGGHSGHHIELGIAKNLFSLTRTVNTRNTIQYSIDLLLYIIFLLSFLLTDLVLIQIVFTFCWSFCFNCFIDLFFIIPAWRKKKGWLIVQRIKSNEIWPDLKFRAPYIRSHKFCNLKQKRKIKGNERTLCSNAQQSVVD